MALRAALRELSTVVGRIEDDGYVVDDVTVSEESLVTDGVVAVGLTVQLPLTEHLAEGHCAEIEVDGCDVRGAIPAELSVRIPLAAVEESAEPVRRTRSDGLPRYKDPVALREVYDRHDTFEDMTEKLDVEVSPSTVRRHMIKHGIHEPEPMYSDGDGNADVTIDAEESSADGDAGAAPAEASVVEAASGRSADEDGAPTDSAPSETTLETKRALTDGIGLPEHLTLDDMVEIVGSSSTVFEVHRKMEVERDRAQRVLQALDLVDLVTGRVSTKAERDVPNDEIRERIHAAIRGTTAG